MKKHILKPGKHQFAPNSPAIHTNDNLSDEEAEWYLKRYPHIAALFAESMEDGQTERPTEAANAKQKIKKRKTPAPQESV